jgi:hypothetical protein
MIGEVTLRRSGFAIRVDLCDLWFALRATKHRCSATNRKVDHQLANAPNPSKSVLSY